MDTRRIVVTEDTRIFEFGEREIVEILKQELSKRIDLEDAVIEEYVDISQYCIRSITFKIVKTNTREVNND